MKPPRQGMGEIIALLVTVALVVVMAGDFAVLATLALRGPTPELVSALKDVFRDLILVFATAWRTNFGGSTTVNTEQANVSSGGGAPSPANVETMHVAAAEERRGVNGP